MTTTAMKSKLTHLPLMVLVAAGVLLTGAAKRPGQRMTFEPEAGLEVTRTVEQEIVLDLDTDLSSETPDGLEVQLKINSSLEFADTFVETEAGRFNKLSRTYNKLQTNFVQYVAMQGEGEEQSFDSGSELEGATVVFSWNADDEEYDRELTEGDIDDDLLNELESDLDLAGFLPEEEVEEDDSWDIDIETFKLLLDPGREVGITAPGSEDDEDEDEESFLDTLEGDVTATFGGLREDDDMTFAVINIEAEVTGTESSETDIPLPDDTTLLQTEDVEYTLELEGEILWSLENNMIAKATLSGDLERAVEFNVTGEFQGQSIDEDSTQVFVGEISIVMTIE